MDHDYDQVMPSCKRFCSESEDTPKHIPTMNHVGGTLGSKMDVVAPKAKIKYIEPPLDDVWPPPNPGGQRTAKVVDKIEVLSNEVKINISDVEGTRTIFVKVPHEK